MKPGFHVTADVLVLRQTVSGVEILLIQRKYPPFQGHWALPGGFLEKDENAVTAAARELREETGLRCRLASLMEIGSFSDPDRDPRGRTVTIAFLLPYRAARGRAAAGDDAAQAGWFSPRALPEIAFDHTRIIRQGLAVFQRDRTRRKRKRRGALGSM